MLKREMKAEMNSTYFRIKLLEGSYQPRLRVDLGLTTSSSNIRSILYTMM